jgi:hypothetical protein
MKARGVKFLMVLFALAGALSPNASRADAGDPACIDDFMQRLGISLQMKTDPAILQSILTSDMRLDDLPEFIALLGPKLDVPQDLGPMLARIRDAVARKQPAVLEFLCTAIHSGLIPAAGPEALPVIARTVLHAYLLEELTKAMADDPGFMETVRAHLMSKRRELGVDSALGIALRTRDWFAVTKTVSIDEGMKGISDARRQGYMDPSQEASWKYGLGLNILEATTDETTHGYFDNALAGGAMILHPLRGAQVLGDNRVLEYDLSQAWTSLYETWNLAFITANVRHPNLLFPKLLIPQVIDATPGEYIFKRVLALWVSIDFYLFAEIQGENVEIPNADALARLWGRINLGYARGL